MDTLWKCAETEGSSGIVGSRLLYPNQLVQHAGIGFSRRRFGDQIYPYPFHWGRGLNATNPKVLRSREVEAITGGCLMISQKLFHELKGFDECYEHYFEDIDLCLRTREWGKKCYYCAESIVIHHESMSKDNPASFARLYDRSAMEFFGKWKTWLEENDSQIRDEKRRAEGIENIVGVDVRALDVQALRSSILLEAEHWLAPLIREKSDWMFRCYGETTFHPQLRSLFNQANVQFLHHDEYFEEDVDQVLVPWALEFTDGESPYRIFRHSQMVSCLLDEKASADSDPLRLSQIRKSSATILISSRDLYDRWKGDPRIESRVNRVRLPRDFQPHLELHQGLKVRNR
jgi:hypothetical protein